MPGLSNDGLASGPWTALPDPQLYALSVHAGCRVALTPGLGAKAVYVEVRNAEGLVADFSASTLLLLPTALALARCRPSWSTAPRPRCAAA